MLTAHDHWGFCHRQTLTRPDASICSDITACSSCLSHFEDLDGTPQPIQNRNKHVQQHLKKLDLLLSPSRYLAEQYFNADVSPARLAVISNGVDLSAFFAKKRGSSPKSDVVFGVASYLGPHKGIHNVLGAIASLPVGINAKVLFAGSGPLEADIRNFISSHPNGKLVTLLGGINPSAMIDFYNSIDVFVVGSVWPENQPLTIMEAMASGAAVVATSCGGSPELVVDGQTGRLFPPGDYNALASIMRGYAAAPLKAHKHGQGGSRSISRHSLKRTAIRLKDTYEELCADGLASNPLLS